MAGKPTQQGPRPVASSWICPTSITASASRSAAGSCGIRAAPRTSAAG